MSGRAKEDSREKLAAEVASSNVSGAAIAWPSK